MERTTVQVCVRTRPTDLFAGNLIYIDPKAHTIELKRKPISQDRDSFYASGTHDHHQNSCKFKFNHILHNVDQDRIYDKSARSIVQGAMEGVNGTIMSYGQTGSGKTFTMIGDTVNYHLRGITPRALSHVFQLIESRLEIAFTVSISYIEIYNEKIYDLLLEPEEEKQELSITEVSPGRGIAIRGLTVKNIKTELDALNLLYSSELMRTTARHNLNQYSNRSHCILTLNISQRCKSGVSEKVTTSKLNFVDLAGSERLKKSLDLEQVKNESLGDPIIKKESMYINQSLTYLEQCVVALNRKAPGHIPYRQTKLTSILRDSLGGNCNTLLIACIWGEESHLEETASTLRLASRMMRVQNEVHVTEVVDPARLLRNQEKTIRELRQELLMHDALSGRKNISYDNFSTEQHELLKNQLDLYLNAVGPEEENDALPAFESIRQMKEICRIFKNMIIDAHQNASSGVQTGLSLFPKADGNLSSLHFNHSESRLSEIDEKNSGINYVGNLDNSKGFSLGRAPDHAIPPIDKDFKARTKLNPADVKHEQIQNCIETLKDLPFEVPKLDLKIKQDDLNAESDMSAFISLDTVSREQLFKAYFESAGIVKCHKLNEAHAELRKAKLLHQTTSVEINVTKKEIDEVQSLLTLKKGRKNLVSVTGEQVLMEEDYNLICREKDAKRQYKEKFRLLTSLRKVREEAQAHYDMVRFELTQDFESWVQTKVSTSGSVWNDESVPRTDENELYEIMKMNKICEKDPNSLPFFKAMRNAQATKKQKSLALRQMHLTKRQK